MKIAIITPTPHYGGTEKQVALHALELKEGGYEVTVYCIITKDMLAGGLRRTGIKVVNLSFETLFSHITWGKNDAARTDAPALSRIMWSSLTIGRIWLRAPKSSAYTAYSSGTYAS